MTRLKTTDIEHLAIELQSYDEQLRRSTGLSLQELGCRAAGVDPDLAHMAGKLRVAAVPVTSGEGVIGHFSETLAAIATALGFTAEVTEQSDIGGIAEAYQKGCDIILASDDDMFCAINTRTGFVAENSEATARGFVHGLVGMAGGLAGKRVLVLGCGPVGVAGVQTLVACDARVTVYDPDQERCQAVVAALPEAEIEVAAGLDEALAGHSLIVEATPVADVVDAAWVTNETCIAAPGVPCGASKEAAALLGDRLLWEPLQIGVATMLMAAAFAKRSTVEKSAA